MRTHLLTLARSFAAVGVVGPLVCIPVQAASDITIAAIASGRLYVVGTTDRPHTPITLDSRFTTESDNAGKFQYELVYHPARCIVAAEIEGRAYEAVVSNCGQQGPAGPAGPSGQAAAPASVVIASAAPVPDTKAADVVVTAALLDFAAMPLPLPARLPKPAQPTARKIDRTKPTAALVQAPVHRMVVRAMPHLRKPIPRIGLQRDQGVVEIPVAD